MATHFTFDVLATPPIPTCRFMDNCTALLGPDGCCGCHFLEGPFDEDGEPVGIPADACYQSGPVRQEKVARSRFPRVN